MLCGGRVENQGDAMAEFWGELIAVVFLWGMFGWVE